MVACGNDDRCNMRDAGPCERQDSGIVSLSSLSMDKSDGLKNGALTFSVSLSVQAT